MWRKYSLNESKCIIAQLTSKDAMTLTRTWLLVDYMWRVMFMWRVTFRVHSCWLRYNCRCEICRKTVVGQHNVNRVDFPDHLTVQSVKIGSSSGLMLTNILKVCVILVTFERSRFDLSNNKILWDSTIQVLDRLNYKLNKNLIMIHILLTTSN